MRYRWRDIPHLLRTPVGRNELLLGQRHNLWPFLRVSAAVYRRFLLRKTRIVTVVGSLGKSTTMRAVGAVLGLPMDLVPPTNSWSGLALSVFRIHPHARHSVLEVGISRPGSMKTYASMIHPDIAVVTAIASEHHQSLGTFEETRFEKSEMVRCLPSSGYAILNGDDPHVRWMATKTRAKVVTYGFGEKNDVRAVDDRVVWPRGNLFSLAGNGAPQSIQTRLYGRHMVYPILAAAAVGLVEGFQMDRIATALASLAPTPGRMEAVRVDNHTTVLNDVCKGTLETIHRAIETLSDIPVAGRIVVLGEVENAPGRLGPIHRDIGRLLARHASKVIVIGSRKSFIEIRSGAKNAGMPEDAFSHAGKYWPAALSMLKRLLSKENLVLIKGRRTQRLERILLALQEKQVRCYIPSCKSSVKTCRGCAMRKRGWAGHRVTVL